MKSVESGCQRPGPVSSQITQITASLLVTRNKGKAPDDLLQITLIYSSIVLLPNYLDMLIPETRLMFLVSRTLLVAPVKRMASSSSCIFCKSVSFPLGWDGID